MIELSLAAAARAQRRGGRWERAAKRLAGQAYSARRRESVSTLPFEILFHQLADSERTGRSRPAWPPSGSATARAGGPTPVGCCAASG